MQFTNKMLSTALGTLMIGTVAVAVVLTKTPPTNPTSVTQAATQQIAQQPASSALSGAEQSNLDRISAYGANVQQPIVESINRNPMPEAAKEQWRKEAIRAQAQEKQAILLTKQGRFVEAEAACYRALELSPKVNGQPSSMEALQLLGDIRFAQGKYKEAIQTYNRAREHTRNVDLDVNTALAYLKLGDIKSARKFYNEEKFFSSRMDFSPGEKAEFFAQMPGTKDIKSFEASLYLARAGEKSSYAAREEAQEDYQKALHLFPRDGYILTLNAENLGRIERYDESLKMWARAAAFGTGKIAEEARFQLRQRMTDAKAEQLARETKRKG